MIDQEFRKVMSGIHAKARMRNRRIGCSYPFKSYKEFRIHWYVIRMVRFFVCTSNDQYEVKYD